jgi:hypothetical protein
MHVRPNKTIIRGEVRSIRRAPGGIGTEVNLRVLSNESPDRDDDFLRPEDGSMLNLYSGVPTDSMPVGDVFRVEARYIARPTGGRAVRQKSEAIEKEGCTESLGRESLDR